MIERRLNDGLWHNAWLRGCRRSVKCDFAPRRFRGVDSCRLWRGRAWHGAWLALALHAAGLILALSAPATAGALTQGRDWPIVYEYDSAVVLTETAIAGTFAGTPEMYIVPGLSVARVGYAMPYEGSFEPPSTWSYSATETAGAVAGSSATVGSIDVTGSVAGVIAFEQAMVAGGAHTYGLAQYWSLSPYALTAFVRGQSADRAKVAFGTSPSFELTDGGTLAPSSGYEGLTENSVLYGVVLTWIKTGTDSYSYTARTAFNLGRLNAVFCDRYDGTGATWADIKAMYLDSSWRPDLSGEYNDDSFTTASGTRRRGGIIVASHIKSACATGTAAVPLYNSLYAMSDAELAARFEYASTGIGLSEGVVDSLVPSFDESSTSLPGDMDLWDNMTTGGIAETLWTRAVELVGPLSWLFWPLEFVRQAVGS